MHHVIAYLLGFALLLTIGTALFFFSLTHGTLIVRSALSRAGTSTAHVYPVYSNMRLIKLIDFQPLISAILLFQYNRLVATIVDEMGKQHLAGKDVLITSCAFGNIIPRITAAAQQGNAREVIITDIIRNELTHAKAKLASCATGVRLLEQNAIAMSLASSSISANVIFFLLHELPHPAKIQALREAARVMAPGGKLYIAEFHRPASRTLQLLSWLYFKVFEPFGLALWNTHDPLAVLHDIGGFTCERRTCCNGNYQIIIATRT